MSVPNPWAKHYQKVWEERAGDPDLPDWFRVAALAFGKHGANGHATFKAGAVALALGHWDRGTGEWVKNTNVSRAVRAAVRFGLLAEGSRARCLIVPHHAVGGGLGSEYAECPIHGYAGVNARLGAVA